MLRLLRADGWLGEGCIVFSQFYDSVWWLANQLSAELPDEPVGIYAGANRSGVLRGGVFERRSRDALKDAIHRRELRLLIGTDAASEGLNLQRLGTLVNLDLPWNPSRLERRKGRIQRIGQVRRKWTCATCAELATPTATVGVRSPATCACRAAVPPATSPANRRRRKLPV